MFKYVSVSLRMLASASDRARCGTQSSARRHVGPVIAACRMLGMLQCLEQFLGREPPRAKVGSLHRSLDAAQDRLELRAKVFMSLRAR